MGNIYLVGFMGTGKTTVAKALAKSLNKKFIDLDDMIVERERRSIREIFAKKGESYFRRIEKLTLNSVAEQKDLVVACGGGIVIDPENIEKMKSTGLIICLEASPEEILNRTKHYRHRPLLNVENPLKRIIQLLKIREPFYKKADLTIDTTGSSVSEVVKKILKYLKDND